jgi:hypothetical protein
MFDDGYDDYIDSVLYADQTNPDFPAYGANGFGQLIYNVVSYLNGNETDVYEGTDYSRAEREAINAYERSYRKAEVVVMRDGGSWKYVFSIPRERVKDAKPVVIECGFCIDPRCGEINPLDCWCRYSMTPAEVERWKAYA